MNHWEKFSIKNLINKIPKEINLRQIIIDHVNSTNYKKTGNLINLIVLNYRDKAINNFYYGLLDLGVAHLFVVSGLHINFLNLIVSKIFKSKLYLSKSINLILTSFYCFLLGMSFGVSRVLINNFLALLTYKNIKNKNLFHTCFSGLIIYLINPFAVFDLGFELSFIGTFIICFSNYFRKEPKLATSLLISFLINLLITPITLEINKKINILTIFNSWILTPLMFIYYLFSLIFFPFTFIYFLFAWFYNLLYELVFILRQIRIFWYFSNLPSNSLIFLYYQVYYLFAIIFIKIKYSVSKEFKIIDDSNSFRRSRINYSRITKDSW